MARETIASVKAEYEARLAAEAQRNGELFKLTEALSASLDKVSATIRAAESRADQADRERYDAIQQRDVLRGFIYREIPVRVEALPGPLSTALGLCTGV